MAPINCPKCGMPNNAQGTFCGNCGYAFQADGAATSSPLQGQPGGAPPPPPMSAYPASNMSSSPMYPGGQTPSPYPASNMSSSPMYPSGGSLTPPSHPNGNMAAPPTFVGGGSPPSSPSSPTYSTNVMPSSPTYQTQRSDFSQPGFPQNDPKLQPQQRRKSKKGLLFAILAIIVLIVLLVGVGGYYVYASHNKTATSSTPVVHASPTTAPTTVSATATPDATGTALASASPTVTPGATGTTSSATATPGPTATTQPSTGNYSATQPGPGCDTSGGTWTPQGFNNITCGTTISVSSANARGYLYFQLPNNTAFSANNSIGITAKANGSSDCVGLAEQDANTGYLVEYCGSGNWNIYSITSGGATVKTLAQSITSTRSSEQLSLSLKGNTLTFTIDTEVHTITITPIHPVKVAITFVTGYGYGASVPVTNFSYIAQ